MPTKKELEEQVKELKAKVKGLEAEAEGQKRRRKKSGDHLDYALNRLHTCEQALEQVLVAPQSEARDVARRALEA